MCLMVSLTVRPALAQDLTAVRQYLSLAQNADKVANYLNQVLSIATAGDGVLVVGSDQAELIKNFEKEVNKSKPAYVPVPFLILGDVDHARLPELRKTQEEIQEISEKHRNLNSQMIFVTNDPPDDPMMSDFQNSCNSAIRLEPGIREFTDRLSELVSNVGAAFAINVLTGDDLAVSWVDYETEFLPAVVSLASACKARNDLLVNQRRMYDQLDTALDGQYRQVTGMISRSEIASRHIDVFNVDDVTVVKLNGVDIVRCTYRQQCSAELDGGTLNPGVNSVLIQVFNARPGGWTVGVAIRNPVINDQTVELLINCGNNAQGAQETCNPNISGEGLVYSYVYRISK